MNCEDTPFQIYPNFERVIKFFPFFDCLKRDPIFKKDVNIFKSIIVLWIFILISSISQLDLKILTVFVLIIAYLYFYIFMSLLLRNLIKTFILLNFLILPIYIILILNYIIYNENFTPFYALLLLIFVFYLNYIRILKKAIKALNPRLLDMVDFFITPSFLFIILISIFGIIDKIFNIFSLLNMHPNILINNFFINFPFLFEIQFGLAFNFLLLIVLPILFILIITKREREINGLKNKEQKDLLIFILKNIMLFFATLFLFYRITFEYFLILINKTKKNQLYKDFVIASILDYDLFSSKLKDYYLVVNSYESKYIKLNINSKDIITLFCGMAEYNSNITLNILCGIRNHILIYGSNKNDINYTKKILTENLFLFLGFGYTEKCIEIENDFLKLYNIFDKNADNKKCVNDFMLLKSKILSYNFSDIESKLLEKKIEILSKILSEDIKEKNVEEIEILISSSIDVCNYCQHLIGKIDKPEINQYISYYLSKKITFLYNLKKSSRRYADENHIILKKVKDDVKNIKKIIKKYHKIDYYRNGAIDKSPIKLIKQLEILSSKIDDNDLKELMITEIDILKKKFD